MKKDGGIGKHSKIWMDFDETFIYTKLKTVYDACRSKATHTVWQQMALQTLWPFTWNFDIILSNWIWWSLCLSTNPSEYHMTFCLCVSVNYLHIEFIFNFILFVDFAYIQRIEFFFLISKSILLDFKGSKLNLLSHFLHFCSFFASIFIFRNSFNECHWIKISKYSFRVFLNTFLFNVERKEKAKITCQCVLKLNEHDKR